MARSYPAAINDFSLEVVRGQRGALRMVRKFGTGTIGQAAEGDVWPISGRYTGWLQSASTVRIKAGGNAADTAAGLGARKVMILGLDENWQEAQEEVTTNGISASAATTTTFIRVFRAYVTESGTYSDANTGAITIETSGGTAVAYIGLTNGAGSTGLGQTTQAIYTVPSGYTAYCVRVRRTVEGTKEATICLHQRQNADDVTTPFTAERVWHTEVAVTGSFETHFIAYAGPFPAKTDIWASAIGPSGSDVALSAEFDLILIAE